MMKQSQSYAVALNGEVAICKEGAVKALSSLNAIKEPCRIVSDLDNAISRKTTVEADPRYVELMVSRRLQETGEFDEPVTVIPHWKKKRGRNATDIFYTALPSQSYFQYLELVSEHNENLVLLPLQSVLMAMIRNYGGHSPIAAVVQHGRFADVLIGSRKKIWFADRVVAFDEGEEQISALWETVRADIDAAVQEHHQKINKLYIATWIDSGPLPQWDDENAPEIICLEELSMDKDGRQVKASLPLAADKATIGQAVATTKDKLFYRAGRALPVLNIIMAAAALLLGVSGIWYQYQSTKFQSQIQKSRQEVRALQTKAPKPIKAVSYQQTLSFLEQLRVSRLLPTYNQILSDMGQGGQAILIIENIKAQYSDEKVEVKAFGKAEAPFELAYKAYQRLQQTLRQRGYRVTETRFDTQINTSSFVLQFEKEVS